nr:hypothetical protein [Tanacetum cinerariifolium]
MVKPEIRGNVNFEIKSQFMRELKKDTFFENKNDDAHEHVERVLDIVSLFNIPGVTHDVVMLHVFPITLTGAAKSPPSKTAKQLEDIHNFKQESDKTLYQAWERYNDLLYKFPIHDINSHQKVNIFCNGLGTMNRQLLNSQGPIPCMTPAQTLTAIQNMVDHSQKWHDSLSSRNIKSSSSSEGIDAIVSKLDSLGLDMKKLEENVHAIQVGFQSCRGAHLDKECPLNEEVKILKEVKYGEYGRPFPNYSQNDRRFNRRVTGYGSHDQPSSDEKKPSLTGIINKHIEEAAKRHAKQDERLRKFYQNVETNRENHGKIIQGLETKETDESRMEEALAALEITPKSKQVPQEEKQSMVEGLGIPIILGRPLLAIAHAKESYEGIFYRMTEVVKETHLRPKKGETYTKVKVLEMDEMPRTRDNVATIRAELMDEISTDRSTKGEA